MTIEQLQIKQDKITNGIYQGQMRSYTNHHLTNLSIEYAISVIQDLRKDAEMGFPFSDQQRIYNWFDNRIDELKALLK